MVKPETSSKSSSPRYDNREDDFGFELEKLFGDKLIESKRQK